MSTLFLEKQLGLPGLTQRWREREEGWRPGTEPIRTSDYEIATIAGDAAPRAFVERHHYSGSYVAARRRFGLYRHGELVGVAVYSAPMSASAMTRYFPDTATSLELGRLVLLDEVPGCGESFFVAETFRHLKREGFVGILSFSDPVPRPRADGSLVSPGHVGIIYQALSARFEGRGTARTIRLLPDGRAMNDRGLQKIRALEPGWEGQVARLVAAGAAAFDRTDPRAWLQRELPRVTRAMRHPGNFRYVWGLSRSIRRSLPANPAGYPPPPGGRASAKWGRRAPSIA